MQADQRSGRRSAVARWSRTPHIRRPPRWPRSAARRPRPADGRTPPGGRTDVGHRTRRAVVHRRGTSGRDVRGDARRRLVARRGPRRRSAVPARHLPVRAVRLLVPPRGRPGRRRFDRQPHGRRRRRCADTRRGRASAMRGSPTSTPSTGPDGADAGSVRAVAQLPWSGGRGSHGRARSAGGRTAIRVETPRSSASRSRAYSSRAYTTRSSVRSRISAPTVPARSATASSAESTRRTAHRGA